MRVLVCVGLLVASVVAVEGAAAQGPAEPAAASVEVTVWRRVSNPSLLYLSTRPEGGSWRTLNVALDMSRRSDSGRFHQSNALTVEVPLASGATANVEVTVWRRVSNPSLLYLSTRPAGGSWRTQDTALDMSGLSSSGRFHQSNAITVEVPLPSGASSQPLAETQNLRWLRQTHGDLYRQITGLPWVRDGVTETEQTAVDNLLYIGAIDIDNLRFTLRLRWVRDDITNAEERALFRLSQVSLFTYLGHSSAQNATTIINLPWFRDGITEIEARTVRSLLWLGDQDDDPSDVDIIEEVVAMRWFTDDISETEHDLLLWLAHLEYESEEAAVAVVDMPFLSSIDREDVLALRALHRLAYYSRDGRLDAVLDHPDLPDGITDHETTLVAATGTLRGASEVHRILGPGNARIEVVREKTRHTPNLKISIIRTGTLPRQSTIDDIRASVEFVEGVMNRPLPVSHIIVVVDDHAVTEGYGGTNYGFAFSVLSGDEQYETPYEAFNFRSKILHEAAHFFWRGHASWIDEGVAETFEYLYGVDAGVSPGLLSPYRGTCEAHNLEMLTEWDSSPGQQARSGCSYFLGRVLFQELLEELGRRAFSQRLRELYRLSLDTKDNPEAETPGIAEVREAFPGQTAVVDKHWSGKLNAPENRPSEGVQRLNHDLVRWDSAPAYDGGSVTFSGTLLDDAVLSKETIADARTGGFQNFLLVSVGGYDYVGTILPPPNFGRRWNLDDPGDVVATEYELDDGTFTIRFRFPQALGDPSNYVVRVYGFQDGNRSSFFGWEVDVLGGARIVESTRTTPPPVPDTPTGVSVSKVDIPLAPDDIDVSWNMVSGATWYELWHSNPGTQWVLKATAASTSYRDTEPGWLVADSYAVRACNAAGCSEFSTVATLN